MIGGRTSNISQRATTPTSAALSGRKRSEPSRAAASNPLTAEPVVASTVGGEGASAYSGIAGVTAFAGGGAGSVTADSATCDGATTPDVDAVASCIIDAIALSAEGCDSAPTFGPVICSICCEGAGETDLLCRDGGWSRSTACPAFFFIFCVDLLRNRRILSSTSSR